MLQTEKLDELRSDSERITSSVSGMSKSKTPSDKVANYAVKIADLQKLIELNSQKFLPYTNSDLNILNVASATALS